MKSPISTHLFVYSSLLKGFHKTSYRYITQFFSFVSNAKVKGTASDVGDELFATPCEDNSFIEGELYSLNDEHDFSYVIGQLDDYEGLIVEEGEKPAYRRELTKVYNDDGELTEAWIYWFNGDVSEKSIVSSESIVDLPIDQLFIEPKAG